MREQPQEFRGLTGSANQARPLFALLVTPTTHGHLVIDEPGERPVQLVLDPRLTRTLLAMVWYANQSEISGGYVSIERLAEIYPHMPDSNGSIDQDNFTRYVYLIRKAIRNAVREDDPSRTPPVLIETRTRAGYRISKSGLAVYFAE